jgi:hypothetical protein
MESGAQLIIHLYVQGEVSLTEGPDEAAHEEFEVHDSEPEHEYWVVSSASCSPHLQRLIWTL